MLSKAKLIKHRMGDAGTAPMKGGAKIFQGAIVVALPTGFADKGHAAPNLVALGVAEKGVLNEGSDGSERIPYRRDGWWLVKNSPTDPIEQADLNKDCFIEDDEVVAKTDGAGTRSVAGISRELDGSGVWIEFK